VNPQAVREAVSVEALAGTGRDALAIVHALLLRQQQPMPHAIKNVKIEIIIAGLVEREIYAILARLTYSGMAALRITNAAVLAEGVRLLQHSKQLRL